MRVNNFQEFNNIIKTTNLPIRQQLSDCITILSKICNCKKQQKNKKAEECNNLYINFIKGNAANLKHFWKTITSDPDISFFHNTHHHIITVKL